MGKYKKNAAARIKELIAALKIKQSDLARRAKTDDGTISSLVSGSRKLAAGMASRIATATGCSLEWLLDGSGEMFPTTTASVYDDTIDDGATPLVAGIYARYLALSESEKEIFDSILTRLFTTSLHDQIEAFMNQNAARMTAPSINQIGDNNNAMIR